MDPISLKRATSGCRRLELLGAALRTHPGLGWGGFDPSDLDAVQEGYIGLRASRGPSLATGQHEADSTSMHFRLHAHDCDLLKCGRADSCHGR